MEPLFQIQTTLIKQHRAPVWAHWQQLLPSKDCHEGLGSQNLQRGTRGSEASVTDLGEVE